MATDFNLLQLSTLDLSDLEDMFRILARLEPDILKHQHPSLLLNERKFSPCFRKIIRTEEDDIPERGDDDTPTQFSVATIPCSSFSALPEDSIKVSGSYYEDKVESLLSTLTREELLEVMKRLIAERGIPASSLRFDRITDNQIVVEKRGRWSRLFNDNFAYGLYLRDPEDEEMLPMKFVHRWSYGIYTMCLIDRQINPDRLHPLSLRRNHESFITLYRLLFGLPHAEAEKVYDRLVSRQVESPDGRVRERAGRFNDCVRDINDALVNSLGHYESIPFKIRSNNTIALSPEKISLPPELLEIKFK